LAGSAQQFDHEVDVVVAGSGAGGMVAAWTASNAGLETLIIEKSDLYGGSTAISGGGAWLPNAPEFLRQGIKDDPEDLLQYLQAIAPDVAPARHRRYIEDAPKLAAALEATPHFGQGGFFWIKGYSDYHPEKGGSPLGRGLWPSPVDRRLLGDLADELRGGFQRVPGAPRGMWMTSIDFKQLIALRWGGLRGPRVLLRLARRTIEARLRGQEMLTSGAALITRLRLVVRDTGTPIWLKTPLKELITDSDGSVIGVVAERDQRLVRIRARRAVVLATGGFEHNEAMRREYQPEVGKGWSLGNPDNTGDGILAGEAVGAALSLMDDAWWMPAMQIPDGVFPLVAERCYPNQFIVNSDGRRFTNESAPYTDFVHDQLEGHRSGVSHLPAFMVIDHYGWTHNIIAGHLPGLPMPKAWAASGSVERADTLEELARRIGVPPGNLVDTAERFNHMARMAVDKDFGRGDSPYDRFYGNPNYPNPSLAELKTPPYYALRILPADLGTKGGLLTDENARVLRSDGKAVPHLYATGNVSAAVMGNDYAGPGATIGTAMTFGWVAAHHIAAGRAADRVEPASV
jgi:3-oxosteroid 1-dehydrogenase